MAKQTTILSTTHIDRHHMQMTKKALEDGANQINNGARLVLTVEHDLTIPPFGKGVAAWVEARSDGEHQLVVENEWFEGILWTELPDGTHLFKQESESDRVPFADPYSRLPADSFLSCDMVNFNYGKDVEPFIEEIRAHTHIEFPVSLFGRKSFIPDPQILVGISKAIGAYLIAKSVLSKAGDKTLTLASEDIARFYTFVRAVVVSAVKYARPKNRPITYVFVVKGNPTLEFIIRSSDPNLVIEGISIEKLESTLTQAEFFYSSLGAAKIQYLFSGDGKWNFNYLLTSTGGVIGTEESLSRRSKRFELLARQSKIESENSENDTLVQN